ncbi:MAG: hypothetical protein J2P49_02590 [Methylocapsa sp.]|nr:hypothetical protein [Methylocapsa sp.]
MTKFLLNRPAAIGAALAIALVPRSLLLSKPHLQQFAALLLAVMGAIYAGFALQKGNLSQIAVEVAAAASFFVGALAALWVSAWVVPIAYIAHGIWDYAHHEGSKLAVRSWRFVVVPTWYPPFCAIYDWVAAVTLTVIWSLRN